MQTTVFVNVGIPASMAVYEHRPSLNRPQHFTSGNVIGRRNNVSIVYFTFFEKLSLKLFHIFLGGMAYSYNLYVLLPVSSF